MQEVPFTRVAGAAQLKAGLVQMINNRAPPSAVSPPLPLRRLLLPSRRPQFCDGHAGPLQLASQPACNQPTRCSRTHLPEVWAGWVSRDRRPAGPRAWGQAEPLSLGSSWRSQNSEAEGA